MRNEEFGPIFDEEVYEAIINGEILAEYPEDIPYPSVLIYGKTKNQRPVHVVSYYNHEEKMAIVKLQLISRARNYGLIIKGGKNYEMYRLS